MVQVIAKSYFSANAIIYDSNYAFGYINVENDLASSGGVSGLTITNSSTSS
jgi:hypothetical protein